MPLIRFSRLVAEATSPKEVFPVLIDMAMAETGADGAAVIEVDPNGKAQVAAHKNVPEEVAAWTSDEDDVIEEAIVRDVIWKLRLFSRVRPLISDKGLFGVLVLVFQREPELTTDQTAVVDALVDLAAAVLSKNARLAHLQQLHDELRATQRALAQAEKLRALGEMAAGVAHDLKNVLNPLSMHLQVLERAQKNKKPELVESEIREMKESLTRGVKTIERLRDYGRTEQTADLDVVDLGALVEEAMSVAKPRLAASKTHIPRLVVDVKGKPRIVGHREEVLSAVVNLVINAIDALKDRGGTITVRARPDDPGSLIEVDDDGPGMPPEVERRVFEPFFTTKGESGSGLGLAMVYACMRRHAGSVELVTREGKGTTFTLRFPRPV